MHFSDLTDEEREAQRGWHEPGEAEFQPLSLLTNYLRLRPRFKASTYYSELSDWFILNISLILLFCKICNPTILKNIGPIAWKMQLAIDLAASSMPACGRHSHCFKPSSHAGPFGCSSDPCILDLISAFLCAVSSALIAYSPIFQPGNLNSPFIVYLKASFGELFYGRNYYSFPMIYSPFIHSNRTPELN